VKKSLAKRGAALRHSDRELPRQFGALQFRQPSKIQSTLLNNKKFFTSSLKRSNTAHWDVKKSLAKRGAALRHSDRELPREAIVQADE
jgi:hypothetical protein